jgi:hypothetical protein
VTIDDYTLHGISDFSKMTIYLGKSTKSCLNTRELGTTYTIGRLNDVPLFYNIMTIWQLLE